MTGHDIAFDGVSKAYAGRPVLADVSFTARAGQVTGFVGRNGAGKTTALRILLGLAAPDSGHATIGGRSVTELSPGTVGASLEPGAHPARTGEGHLLVQAAALGAPAARVRPLLEEVGLGSAGRKKVKTYSFGMRQRLALAAALLPEPAVLVLDEPTNGLDPDGILWLREQLRSAAAGGATVLVSSHLLGELEQVVDEVVVLDRTVLWSGDRAATLDVEGGLEQLYQDVTAGSRRAS
ncbi:ATP-binding cassette domain-containing protein [Motilibacter aurantiacus]|uniref:ATP-binding cassette domain-containing protein n=1 Tax=Motilibacter aurantiacus TaxID=2714955 RepID=UPI002F2B8FED